MFLRKVFALVAVICGAFLRKAACLFTESRKKQRRTFLGTKRSGVVGCQMLSGQFPAISLKVSMLPSE